MHVCTHVCLGTCGTSADNPGLRQVLLCTAVYAILSDPGASGDSLVSAVLLTVEALELQICTTAAAFVGFELRFLCSPEKFFPH